MTPLRELQQYTLLGPEIAEGGMGVVYQAVHRALNRPCALKLIRTGLLATSDERRRFATEAEAAAKLDHPNIVRVTRAAEFEGQWFFEMDLIEGGTLADRIAEGPLLPEDAARLLENLTRAVQHAHERGVLHRNLKPANVLLAENGQPKLTDFGLARFLEKTSDLTRTLAVLGTPAYLAPELASGHAREATTAADIYSLGVILFECLTGRRPFQGRTTLETLRAVQETTTPRPSSLREGLPRDLEVIVLRCMAKEPERRFASAGELAEELARFLNAEPIRSRPVPALERLWLWSRRKPALAAALAFAALAVILGVMGVSWQWTQTKRALRDTRLMSEVLRESLQNFRLGLDESERKEVLEGLKNRLQREFADRPDMSADLLGLVHYSLGELTEAEVSFRSALALYEERYGPSHPNVAAALNSIALMLHKQGQPRRAEAERYYRQAIGMIQALEGFDSPNLDTPRANLAFLLRRLYKLPESEALYRKLWELESQRHGRESWEAGLAARPVLQVMLDQKKFSEAGPLASNALHTLDHLRPDAWQTYDARSLLGGCFAGQSKHAKAEPLLLAGAEGMLARVNTNSFIARVSVQEALRRLVQHFETTESPARAEEWRRKLEVWDRVIEERNNSAGANGATRRPESRK